MNKKKLLELRGTDMQNAILFIQIAKGNFSWQEGLKSVWTPFFELSFLLHTYQYLNKLFEGSVSTFNGFNIN